MSPAQGGQRRKHGGRRRQHRQQQSLPLGGGVLHGQPGKETLPAAPALCHRGPAAVHHLAWLPHGDGAQALAEAPVHPGQAPQRKYQQNAGQSPQGRGVHPFRQQQEGHLVQQGDDGTQRGGGADAPRPIPQALDGGADHRPADNGGRRVGDQYAQRGVVPALAEKGQGNAKLGQDPGQPQNRRQQGGQMQALPALPATPLIPHGPLVGKRFVLRVRHRLAQGGFLFGKGARDRFPGLFQPLAQTLLPLLLLLLHRVHGVGHQVFNGLHGDRLHTTDGVGAGVGGGGRLFRRLRPLGRRFCRPALLRPFFRLLGRQGGGVAARQHVSKKCLVQHLLCDDRGFLRTFRRLCRRRRRRFRGRRILWGFRRRRGYRRRLFRSSFFRRRLLRNSRLRCLRRLRLSAGGKLSQDVLQGKAALRRGAGPQEPLGVHQGVGLRFYLIVFQFICHNTHFSRIRRGFILLKNMPLTVPLPPAAGAPPRTAVQRRRRTHSGKRCGPAWEC